MTSNSNFAEAGVDSSPQQNQTDLRRRYLSVRNLSLRIAEPLSAEDCAIQSMPDVSPTRWHLAHTTWFFETFLLKPQSEYRCFDEAFEYLFNSYYNTVGKQFPRDRRGTISRPGLSETLDYRSYVDEMLSNVLDGELSEKELAIVELGLQHEQQHQELMLTDIKHVLFSNPLYPAYQENAPANASQESGAERPVEWIERTSGLSDIGFSGPGFFYDNEGPVHTTYLQEHAIANRCVTNGEYLEFVLAGGYHQPEYWLSLGWSTVQSQNWMQPLYWLGDGSERFEFTLCGKQPLDLGAPVSHLSYFEADAFARWYGARLPTEAEWESFATTFSDRETGVFVDQFLRTGQPVHPDVAGICNPLGNLWEWTSSPYTAYPGYAPPPGAIGEYNGKFMCNQYVLRGDLVQHPEITFA